MDWRDSGRRARRSSASGPSRIRAMRSWPPRLAPHAGSRHCTSPLSKGVVKPDLLTEQLLRSTAFYPALTPEQAARLRADTVARPFNAGANVRRRGTVADGWLGVASGLVKIENSSADGRHTTLTHFSAGCWFGEGTLLKEGP